MYSILDNFPYLLGFHSLKVGYKRYHGYYFFRQQLGFHSLKVGYKRLKTKNPSPSPVGFHSLKVGYKRFVGGETFCRA